MLNHLLLADNLRHHVLLFVCVVRLRRERVCLCLCSGFHAHGFGFGCMLCARLGCYTFRLRTFHVGSLSGRLVRVLTRSLARFILMARRTMESLMTMTDVLTARVGNFARAPRLALHSLCRYDDMVGLLFDVCIYMENHMLLLYNTPKTTHVQCLSASCLLINVPALDAHSRLFNGWN